MTSSMLFRRYFRAVAVRADKQEPIETNEQRSPSGTERPELLRTQESARVGLRALGIHGSQTRTDTSHVEIATAAQGLHDTDFE